ncbi:DUF2922 domain-containing protein [Neobacillus ginsengisoli]|uniref:DUF2922 domain-containing protein n=2 Tax=Neobacillus TaxID=2675232 RepID=A0ABT9Y2B4_9BACI|nr:DUF2922 domain-containing protein [Neobacillus ginsengisoli]MCM2535856.1 DUF2922 domain-containing protein [Neobacillus pocheonensis]MDQ0201909.1 hypothetical protein [Neobacillus ginsengisoli]
MAKTLELQFVTEFGKTARLTVDNPKEPVNEAVVKQSMADIIASGIINTAGGNLVSAQGARIVDRNITDYKLA